MEEHPIGGYVVCPQHRPASFSLMPRVQGASLPEIHEIQLLLSTALGLMIWKRAKRVKLCGRRASDVWAVEGILIPWSP